MPDPIGGRRPGISVVSPQLPTGGGALRGIAESFQARELTGTAALAIPIPVTAARGAEPVLRLEYDSGQGNGPFGLGVELGLPSVARRTSKGVPRYDASDVFVLSGSDELVETGEASYRPRTEGEFARIERLFHADGTSSWRTIDRAGVVSLYGTSAESRIADPADPTGRIFQWLLAETRDPYGNRVRYEYRPEDGEGVGDAVWERSRSRDANRYPSRIRYGNAVLEPAADSDWRFEVVFDYGERDLSAGAGGAPYSAPSSWTARRDPFSHYRAGFEIRTHRLCRGVLMFHRFPVELGDDPVLVRAVRLGYHESATATQLGSVRQVGFRKEAGGYESVALPPLELEYIPFQPDGREWEPLADQDERVVPGLMPGGGHRLVDLYGEGVPGVLYTDPESALYRRPVAGHAGSGPPVRYAPPAPLPVRPLAGMQGHDRLLLDVLGDGRLSLMVTGEGEAGFFANTGMGGWSEFKPFDAFPSEFSHPAARLVDATGAATPDLLVLDAPQARLYPSLGAGGFAAECVLPLPAGAPRSVEEAAGDSAVRFADLFGGGGQHLVRVAAGRVECWPNLGQGRFGDAVLLGNAPDFGADFDPSRLLLADVDGSGTADLVYLYPDRAEVYPNLSGNSFAEPFSVPLPATWDHLGQLQVADVYGRGAQCLVFSREDADPGSWCYDFTAGRKPYLLCAIRNNRGAHTTLEYASSTDYYLRDRASGAASLTPLPFPVQVVARVETSDEIAGSRLVRSYTYRHGYWDAADREFRGFGMVEHLDAERPAPGAVGAPPLLTRSWYHTGAPPADGSLGRPFAAEYWRGDPAARPIADSEVEGGAARPGSGAWSEAARALKGLLLREESYGLDGSALEPIPYSVTETAYSVRPIVPPGRDGRGVSFAYRRESLARHYERNAADPRVGHEVVLEVDEYGSVLRTASVAYGRRATTGEELPEQLRPHGTIHEAVVQNLAGPELRLLGVPVEERSHDFAGLPVHPDLEHLDAREVAARAAAALAADDRLLLSWTRHLYRSPATGEILPLGGVSDAVLLPARDDSAALDAEATRAALAGALDPAALDALLAGDGGYRLDEGLWWRESSTTMYLGAEHFYLPAAVIDPFGAATRAEYDEHHLLPVLVEDALGNVTVAERVDYQALHPTRVRDPNGVVGEVLLDPLGRVRVTSHHGSELGRATGFAPLGALPAKPASLAELLANPADFLQQAATYAWYDDLAWMERRLPTCTATVAATTYPGSPPGPFQAALTYLDGLGREVQTLSRAEPGGAWAVGENGSAETRTSGDRWLASGRAVLDDKGNPVRQYEPYYQDGFVYVDHPALARFGVSDTLRYDALGRLVEVETAKGFLRREEHGAWESAHFDENDTVRDAPYYRALFADGAPRTAGDASPELARECASLRKALACVGTPSRRVHDSLGRVVRSVELLEGGRALSTKREYDRAGNLVAIADPRLGAAGLENTRTVHGLDGQTLRAENGDTGARWQLKDALGRPLYARDARAVETVLGYDALHRPAVVRVREGGADQPFRTAQRMVYGDSVAATGERVLPDAAASNQCGRLYRHYDTAGLFTVGAYSIDGMPLSGASRFAADHRGSPDWTNPAAAEALLRAGAFDTRQEYDAIGRPTRETAADGSVIELAYALPGMLSQVRVRAIGEEAARVYVAAIDYNARGQRSRVQYGNGVTAVFQYEDTTFRLVRARASSRDGTTLQDLSYAYDPVGNLTHSADGAFAGVFGGTPSGMPESDFTFDSLYRLVRATGLEHPAAAAGAEGRGDYDPDTVWPLSAAHPNDLQRVRGYTRLYSYDDGGNLCRLRHVGADSASRWTRDVTLAPDSNRGVESDLAGTPEGVAACFDAAGHQVRLAGLAGLRWNAAGELASAVVVEREGNASDAEYYVYDAGGRRVRRVTERYGEGGASARVEETLYLGPLEILRVSQGGVVVEERSTLRVMAAERCAALRVAWTVGSPPEGVASPHDRYQLDDLVDSSVVEVDGAGKVIAYELFYPYGGTALTGGRSLAEVKLRRYRYAGKERDVTTGLYHYGARYYACWTGRWLSPDPAGAVDGPNLYAYVGGNPVTHADSTGLGKESRDKGGNQSTPSAKTNHATKLAPAVTKKVKYRRSLRIRARDAAGTAHHGGTAMDTGPETRGKAKASTNKNTHNNNNNNTHNNSKPIINNTAYHNNQPILNNKNAHHNKKPILNNAHHNNNNNNNNTLNLQQVPYESSSEAAAALAYRAKQVHVKPVAGKNVCVLAYTINGHYGLIVQTSNPSEGVHSEPIVWNAWEALKSKNPGAQLEYLYTERAPCGVGGGMKNCTAFLLEKLGGTAVPIYYSFDYPSSGKDETNELLDEIGPDLVAGDDDAANKAYLHELAVWFRATITRTLKKQDKS